MTDKSVHITLITTGLEDDIVPFVQLGNHLRSIGYGVSLVSPNLPALQDQISFDHTPLSVNSLDLLKEPGIQQKLEGGIDIIQLVRQFKSADMSLLTLVMEETFQACMKADMILSHVATSIFAQSIAEKLGIPFISAVPDWKMTTRIFGTLPTSSRFDFGGDYNRVTGRIIGYILWRIFGGAVNQFRRDTLGLAEPHSALSYQERGLRLIPVLSATAKDLATIPTSWGDENIYVTDAWHTRHGKQQASDVIHRLKQKGV